MAAKFPLRLSRLKRILKLSWREWRLLSEAFVLLGGVRFAVLVVPFRYISARLGTDREETPYELTPQQREALSCVAWAVQTAAANAPWRDCCLTQAIVAKVMLRRRTLRSMLYLGVKREKDGKLRAHAWLTAGGRLVVGTEGMPEFSVVAKYR
jgi:hypothetical protein